MPAKDRTYIDPDAEEDYFSAEEHDSVGSGDNFDQGPSSRGGRRVGGLGGGKKGAESRLKSKGKGGDVSLSLSLFGLHFAPMSLSPGFRFSEGRLRIISLARSWQT